MGKKRKRQNADEVEPATPPAVADSDDGSTETETDALLGDDESD